MEGTQQWMLQSFIAEKGGSCQQKAKQLCTKVQLKWGKRAGQLSLVDVAVDVVQVLGHLGEDARPVGQSAAAVAPIAHDAHLHEATVCLTQQRTTVIPLKHKACTHPRCQSKSVWSTKESFCVPHFSRYEDFNMCQLPKADQPRKLITSN